MTYKKRPLYAFPPALRRSKVGPCLFVFACICVGELGGFLFAPGSIPQQESLVSSLHPGPSGPVFYHESHLQALGLLSSRARYQNFSCVGSFLPGCMLKLRPLASLPSPPQKQVPVCFRRVEFQYPPSLVQMLIGPCGKYEEVLASAESKESARQMARQNAVLHELLPRCVFGERSGRSRKNAEAACAGGLSMGKSVRLHRSEC